ncbi:unnamed protein product [Nippostrongylus brasiliensis]|uniref:DUF4158 domain-containing protein n=1 Tax=Nippostrongylus brasiliensis TaxID=27835 RepID=A0A0N4Y455_NIPBR|nr:unnamed protein product [Nippostrongylus brasiliensis]
MNCAQLERKRAVHFTERELTVLMELYAENYSLYHGSFNIGLLSWPCWKGSPRLPINAAVCLRNLCIVTSEEDFDDDVEVAAYIDAGDVRYHGTDRGDESVRDYVVRQYFQSGRE